MDHNNLNLRIRSDLRKPLIQVLEPLFKSSLESRGWLTTTVSTTMFSPEVAPPSHGHSLRPKRSRRTGSDDSIKLPRAKRRRSALRRDTFEPLSDLSPNEVAVSTNRNISTNGHLPEDKSEHDVAVPAPKELTFRAAKKPEKRADRGSGTMTLVGVV